MAADKYYTASLSFPPATISPVAGVRYALHCLPIFARRDDFVGQVGNLRRIVNPPAPGNEANAQFAAGRHVGQVAKTCGRLSIGLSPDVQLLGCGDAALWGSQSWLQPAFSRLAPTADTLISAARNAPERNVCRACECVFCRRTLRPHEWGRCTQECVRRGH